MGLTAGYWQTANCRLNFIGSLKHPGTLQTKVTIARCSFFTSNSRLPSPAAMVIPQPSFFGDRGREPAFWAHLIVDVESLDLGKLGPDRLHWSHCPSGFGKHLESVTKSRAPSGSQLELIGSTFKVWESCFRSLLKWIWRPLFLSWLSPN